MKIQNLKQTTVDNTTQIQNIIKHDIKSDDVLIIDLTNIYDIHLISPEFNKLIEVITNYIITTRNVSMMTNSAEVLNYDVMLHRELKKYISSGKQILILDKSPDHCSTKQDRLRHNTKNIILALQREHSVRCYIKKVEVTHSTVYWINNSEII